MYCENDRNKRVDLSGSDYKSCEGSKCGGWKWVKAGCAPWNTACQRSPGAWLPAAEVCRLNLYAKFEKRTKPSYVPSSSTSSHSSSSSSSSSSRLASSSSSEAPVLSLAIRPSSDCPTTCDSGCCPREGWFCCADGIYCAATEADCPLSEVGALVAETALLYDPNICPTECPAGCCPGENWFCCPDNLHCAATAEDCPSASDVQDGKVEVNGQTVDLADHIDLSYTPIRSFFGAENGQIVVPPWYGFNKAVYIDSLGVVTTEYVTALDYMTLKKRIVLGYDPAGSQRPGLLPPPDFTIDRVNESAPQKIYLVTITPVLAAAAGSGSTGYVFRFDNESKAPNIVGPRPAMNFYPAISQNQVLFLGDEIAGTEVRAATVNENGVGQFGDPVVVESMDCELCLQWTGKTLDDPNGKFICPCKQGLETCCNGDCIDSELFKCCGDGLDSYACPKDNTCCGKKCCDVKEFCCGDQNCCSSEAPAEICIDGKCCPDYRACGEICCPDGQHCVDGVCCPESRACGEICCEETEECTLSDEGEPFCCPAERQCGFGSCCPEGERCVNDECCPSDRATSNINCCPEGERACGTFGVDAVCCPEKRVCCEGTCCPDGESCVDGICRPKCIGDEDCGEGQCCKDGDCVDCPKCTSDGDCGGCERCLAGNCYSDCDTCSTCVDGKCNSSCDEGDCCTGIGDCGPCKSCDENNPCTDECTTCWSGKCETFCKLGECCDGVGCVPCPSDCEDDSDCKAELCESCQEGKCKSHCKEGESCVGGTCQPTSSSTTSGGCGGPLPCPCRCTQSLCGFTSEPTDFPEGYVKDNTENASEWCVTKTSEWSNSGDCGPETITVNGYTRETDYKYECKKCCDDECLEVEVCPECRKDTECRICPTGYYYIEVADTCCPLSTQWGPPFGAGEPACWNSGAISPGTAPSGVCCDGKCEANCTSSVSSEPMTINGTTVDPNDHFDTSLPPMNAYSGNTGSEFVVPEWLGYNNAVYVDSSGVVTEEYVAPGDVLTFKSTIVLGYDPEGSQVPGLPAPPEFTVSENIGNVEVGPVYKVSVTPVSGATGYVFRFNGVAIRPTYIGPQLAASALPEGLPAIGENEYLYTTELDGYSMTAASTNGQGTGSFSGPTQIGERPCDTDSDCTGPCEGCSAGRCKSTCPPDGCCVDGECGTPCFMGGGGPFFRGQSEVPCCKSSETCISGSCCPNDNVCSDDGGEFCCECQSDSDCTGPCEGCSAGRCKSTCPPDGCCVDGECGTPCFMGGGGPFFRGQSEVPCCKSSETCISGSCCPNDNVCEGGCCGAGQCCVDGQCEDCCSPDYPCSSGCDACVDGKCVSTCDGCSECVDGYCDSACDNDGEVGCCINGMCEPTFTPACNPCPEGGCPEGLCCADGLCQDCEPCPDAGCPGGQCCTDGKCEDCTNCLPGGGCPEGQCCTDGSCEDCKDCTTSEDCSPCHICSNGKCIYACDVCSSCKEGKCDSACDADQCCVNNMCEPSWVCNPCPPEGCADPLCCADGKCQDCVPCETGSCPEGQCCTDGKCEDCPCSDDSECEYGSCCVDGECGECPPCVPPCDGCSICIDGDCVSDCDVCSECKSTGEDTFACDSSCEEGECCTGGGDCGPCKECSGPDNWCTDDCTVCVAGFCKTSCRAGECCVGDDCVPCGPSSSTSGLCGACRTMATDDCGIMSTNYTHEYNQEGCIAADGEWILGIDPLPIPATDPCISMGTTGNPDLVYDPCTRNVTYPDGSPWDPSEYTPS